MSDALRKAIQDLLDTYQDGWLVSDYVVCLGLERMHGSELESGTWHYAPPDQADWKTGALIQRAVEARDFVEWDDE